MKNTHLKLILTALVGLAVGRIGDHGVGVNQEHGNFIEKPERELDLTAFGGLRTEGSGDLLNSDLYGGFGPGAENSGDFTREVDPGYLGDLFNAGLYGGFGPGAENSGGLNREVGPDDYRVIVACKDDGCMERVKSLGQVHYEYRYIKAIAVTIQLATLARLNVDADVE
jgi:hypothetical protein